MKMLYVYGGEEDKVINDDILLSGFSYQVDSGRVVSQVLSSVNDEHLLNRIATETAGKYTEFVFSLNRSFSKSNYLWKSRLSLYFISDIGCKRTEIFDSFRYYCVCVHIRRLQKELGFDDVIIDSCPIEFSEALMSVLKKPATVIDCGGQTFITIKPLAKATLYYFKFFIWQLAASLIGLLKVSLHKIRPSERLFLTRFPKHLKKNLADNKYGDFVSEQDGYLVNLIADGMHQNLGLREYLAALRFLKGNPRVVIMDQFLTLGDIALSSRYIFFVFFVFRAVSCGAFHFDGVDLSKVFRREIMWSADRVSRLLLWDKAVERISDKISISEFYYFLHEYPYGRFFNYSVKTHFKGIKRVGFQHGPASNRKLVYFAARGELSHDANSIDSFPTPSAILAEDNFSRHLYERMGYKNVTVMDFIFRYIGCKEVVPDNDRNITLICPGLHDGRQLLKYLVDKKYFREALLYVVVPHPRSNNGYLDDFGLPSNVSVDLRGFNSVVGSAETVVATYSSVAVEAMMLGINVDLINLPGRINESPLLDADFINQLKSKRS